MDQNTSRDDASGAHPEGEPVSGGGEGPAWSQPDQSAQDQGYQAGAGGPDQAAAEYAAWSADASYQQQQAGQAESSAYAAPEPQSATYIEQGTGAPMDPQVYAQQQYQQSQQGYDPSAYGQQYQQPQGYQQPYQQYPPAGQPYAYAQPGQQPWAAPEPYWDQEASGYGRSFLAVLAGFVLFTWGVVTAVVGGIVLWLGDLDQFVDSTTVSAEVLELVEQADQQITATGGILAILGIILMIAAVGIWAHRRWGRAFGIVLGLLGTILGIGILVVAVGFEALDVGLDQATTGESASIGAGLLILGTFVLVLVAMIVGRRHFRLRGVSG